MQISPSLSLHFSLSVLHPRCFLLYTFISVSLFFINSTAHCTYPSRMVLLSLLFPRLFSSSPVLSTDTTFVYSTLLSTYDLGLFLQFLSFSFCPQSLYFPTFPSLILSISLLFSLFLSYSLFSSLFLLSHPIRPQSIWWRGGQRMRI